MAQLPVSPTKRIDINFNRLFDNGFMKVVGNKDTVFEGGVDEALRELWKKLLEKAKGTEEAPICPENGEFWNKAIPFVRDSGDTKLKDLAAVQALPDKEKKITKVDRLKSMGTKGKAKLETLKKNVELNRVLTVLLDVVNKNVADDSVITTAVNIASHFRIQVMKHFEKVDGKWKLKAEPGDITVSQLLLPPIKDAKSIFQTGVWNVYSKSEEFKKWLTKTKSGKLVAEEAEKWRDDAAKKGVEDRAKRAREATRLAEWAEAFEKEHGRPPTMGERTSYVPPDTAHIDYSNELNLDYGRYQQPPQYQVEHYPYFDGYGSSRRQDVMVLPPQSNGYYVMPPDQFAVGGMAPAYSAYQDNALLLVLLMLVLALFGCVCLCASAAIGWFSGRKSVQDRGSKVWSPIAQEVDEV